jgi:hypothetical protein
MERTATNPNRMLNCDTFPSPLKWKASTGFRPSEKRQLGLAATAEQRQPLGKVVLLSGPALDCPMEHDLWLCFQSIRTPRGDVEHNSFISIDNSSITHIIEK